MSASSGLEPQALLSVSYPQTQESQDVSAVVVETEQLHASPDDSVGPLLTVSLPDANSPVSDESVGQPDSTDLAAETVVDDSLPTAEIPSSAPENPVGDSSGETGLYAANALVDVQVQTVASDNTTASQDGSVGPAHLHKNSIVEQRTETLLSANPPPESSSVEPFVFDMSAGSNRIFLRLSTVSGAQNLQITDDTGAILAASPLLSTDSVCIYGQTNVDDTLTVDLTDGAIPVPIAYNGGAGGFDTLVIQGGHYATATYAADGPDAGTIVLGAITIHYTGLEPVVDHTIVAARTFTDPGLLGHQIRLCDDGDPTNGYSLIDSNGTGGFESLTFRNPTTSLTIDAGAGDDTIILGGLDRGFAAALVISGETGKDTVEITGDLRLPGQDLTVTAETINVHAGVTIDTRHLNGSGLTDADSGSIELESSTPALAAFMGAMTITLNSGVSLFSAAEDVNVYDRLGAYSDQAVAYLFNLLDQIPGLGISAITGVSGQIIIRHANATVSLTDATITSSGSVTIASSASSDSSLQTVSLNGIGPTGAWAISIGYGEAHATAETTLGGSTRIVANDAVDVTSSAATGSFVKSRAAGNLLGSSTPTYLAVAFAVSNTNETSHVTLAHNASIQSLDGSVNLGAEGEVENYSWATPTIYEDGAVVMAFALAYDTADIWARVDGTIDATGSDAGTEGTFSARPGDGQVNYGTDIITLVDHGFADGDEVVYSHGEVDLPLGTGEPPDMGGLKQDGTYYVQVIDEDHFRLAAAPTIDLDYAKINPGADPVHTLSRLVLLNFDSAGVDTTNDWITFATPHGFAGGELVKYVGNPDGPVVGLVQNKNYKVQRVSATTLQLLDPANGDAVVDLTDAGTGGQAFYYVTGTRSFTPVTAVNSDTNTITFTSPHGFHTGDPIIYPIDPTISYSQPKAPVAFTGGLSIIDDHTIGIDGDQTPLIAAGAGATVTVGSSSATAAVVSAAYDSVTNTTSVVLDHSVVAAPLTGVTFERTGTVTLNDVPLDGLSDGSVYFIVKVDDYTVRLVASQQAAEKATPIDLTQAVDLLGTGLGQAHSLRTAGTQTGIGIHAGLGAANLINAGAVLTGDEFSWTTAVEEGIAGNLEQFVACGTQIAQKIMGQQPASSPTQAGTSFGIAGAIVVNYANHDVQAIVGSSARLASSRDIGVVAEIEESSQASASAEASKPEDSNAAAAVAVSVAIGYFDNHAEAIVDSGAELDATNAIYVESSVTLPFLISNPLSVINPLDYLAQCGPEGWGYFMDGTLGFASGLFNSFIESSASQAKVSGGGSFAIDIYINHSIAKIRSDAQINQNPDARFRTGDQTVEVTAETQMDFVRAVGVGGISLNISGGVEAFTTGRSSGVLEGLEELITPFGAEGDKGGIGASFVVVVDDNTTEAAIETGAKVHTGWSRHFNPADAGVVASNWITLSDVFDLPTGTAVIYRKDPASTAIGGLEDGKTYYVIGDPGNPNRIQLAASAAAAAAGTAISLNPAAASGAVHRLLKTEAEGLALSAGIRIFDFDFSEAGASGSTFGVSGAFSIGIGDSKTHAHIDSGVVIDSDGDIAISATDDLTRILVTGGVVSGANIGVGVSVSLNLLTRDTQAYIGTELGNSPGTAGTEIHAAGAIEMNAESTGSLWTAALAAAVPGAPPQEKTVANNQSAQNAPSTATSALGGGGGGGSQNQVKIGVGIAGDVSINVLDEKTCVYINDAGLIDTDEALTLSALSDSAIWSLAGAVAIVIKGNQTSVGIAGSLSANILTGQTSAFIAEATVYAGSITIDAQRKGGIRSLTAAGSGAPLKSGIAVAGSISVNVVLDDVEAYLSDVNAIVGGDCSITAQSEATIIAVGGAVGFGGRAGVGVGIAINVMGDDAEPSVTRASIEGSRLTITDGTLELSATNENPSTEARIISIAASVGVGNGPQSVAGAGTISVNIITNDTLAYVTSSTIVELPGDPGVLATEIKAKDTSGIISLSGAVGISKQASIGVAIAYNEIDNDVRAYLDYVNLTEDGALTIDAQSQAVIGGAAVGVAVAASGPLAGAGSLMINVINDTTDAHMANTLGASSSITCGGITLHANDGSVMVSITGGVAAAPGGSVAVGAALSYNLIQNSIEAYIDHVSVEALGTSSVDISATSTSLLIALALAGAGAQGFALGGSITVNSVANGADAHILGATVKAPGGNVSVISGDQSTLFVVAGAAAGSTGGAAVGASLAYNYLGGSFNGANPSPIEYNDSMEGTVTPRLGRQFNPGSPISTSDDTIDFGYSHGLQTGDAVVYRKGSGSAVGGLVDGTTYYVIKISSETIQLAATLADAQASDPVAINLTSKGTGTGHKLEFGTRTLNLDPSVSVSGNTIDFGRVHGFETGQAVIYSKGSSSNTAVGGLTDGHTYYVIKVSDTAIKLAQTQAQATAPSPTAINLTSTGSGTGHMLERDPESMTKNKITAYIESSEVLAGGVLIVQAGFESPANLPDPTPEVTREVKVFDPADAVDTTEHTIDFGFEHGLSDGQAVLYNKGGAANTPIGLLTDNTTYYVIVVDGTTIQLAATKADAEAKSPILINSTGTGTGHTIRLDAKTFNPATALDVRENTVDFGFDHNLRDDQAVVYRKGLDANTPIGGLVDGHTYYVDVVDDTTIRLRTSPGGSIVSLTSKGTGTAHVIEGLNKFDPDSAVDEGDKTIDLGVDHGLAVDDKVVYHAGSDELAIDGLADGATYYVVYVHDHKIKLSKTEGGSAIAIGLNSHHSYTSDHSIGKEIEFTPRDTVNTTDDIITFSHAHGLVTGQFVIYRKGAAGNEPIGGLVDGRTYYVICVSDTKVKLAATEADALAVTPVALHLTSRGTGTSHSLAVNPPQVDMGIANIDLPASITSQLVSITVAGAGGNDFALGGAISLNLIRNSVDAHISDTPTGKEVRADGAITVAATDTSKLGVGAAGFAGSGTAAVGAAVAYNDIRNRTTAAIDDAKVTSVNGEVLVSATELAQNVNVAVGGAGAGEVSVTGSLSINVIKNTDQARIAGGSDVNAAGDVTVQAKDTSSLSVISGNGGGAGTVAVGIAFAVNDVANAIHATIDGSSVQSVSGDIVVDAQMAQPSQLPPGLEAQIAASAVSGGGAGYVGVNGSITLNWVRNDTEAKIANVGSGQQIQATNGTVGVWADDSSTINSFVGAGSGAGIVAVGVSVSYNYLGGDPLDPLSHQRNRVAAVIEDSSGPITAQSVEAKAAYEGVINNITFSGSGAGIVSVSGSIALNWIHNTSDAHILNCDNITATDSVLVEARDTSTIRAIMLQGSGGSSLWRASFRESFAAPLAQ